MVGGSEKADYWIKHYPPDKRFTNGPEVVAEVYFMPAGSLEEIRAAGY
jgi:hypothetical protein